jgi:hypothetical protein
LTTIWDHFDAGRAKEIKDHTTVVLPDRLELLSRDPYDEFELWDLWRRGQNEPMSKDKEKEKEKE